MKIVLSIAGSDSSGGAGIQADIKSGFYHKVFMTTAITAVTVQNTLGVTDVVVLKPEFVVKQIKSVIEDFKVNCIKIGGIDMEIEQLSNLQLSSIKGGEWIYIAGEWYWIDIAGYDPEEDM